MIKARLQPRPVVQPAQLLPAPPRPPLASHSLQLLNKADLLEEEQLEELVRWYRAHCKADVVVPLSALHGVGLEAVREWIYGKLPESPSLYPKVWGGREWHRRGERFARCAPRGGKMLLWPPSAHPHTSSSLPPTTAGHCERAARALLRGGDHPQARVSAVRPGGALRRGR